MRLLVHAGTPGDGSSEARAAWHASFSEDPSFWMPLECSDSIAWWLARDDRRPFLQPLPNWLDRAASRSVETLFLSGDDFGRLRRRDWIRLLDLLAGSIDLHVWQTICRPARRWSGGHSELVDSGSPYTQLQSVAELSERVRLPLLSALPIELVERATLELTDAIEVGKPNHTVAVPAAACQESAGPEYQPVEAQLLEHIEAAARAEEQVLRQLANGYDRWTVLDRGELLGRWVDV